MLVSDNYAGSWRRIDAFDTRHGNVKRIREMSRRTIVTTLAVIVLAVALGAALYAKSASAVTPGMLVLAGDVRVDENVVVAPTITYPTPDYTVGIPTTATAAPKRKAPAAPSRLPVVSGFLKQVFVAEGTHVTSGEPVAQLDTAMLDLGVRQAETARAKSQAALDVLDNNLDKLATARAKLVTARATLLKTRAAIETTLTTLLKTRTSLEASISAIEKLIAMPGGPPPHVPPFTVILAGMKAGLAQLNTGIAAIKTGLVKINQGFAMISTGFTQLDTARTQLQNARKLVVISVGAQTAAVDLAKAARGQATILASATGVVTYVRPAGTAVMVGAPVVRIRPDGPTHVYTYLTADELAQVSIGTRATVSFDSNPGAPLAGHVSYLGDVTNVPPTSFPTSVVHMTRAVRVTIQLDDGQTAPPGTPVDIEISTSR
jgi:multidrug efflux pump subunit AcrA (membrane-fusion protein)